MQAQQGLQHDEQLQEVISPNSAQAVTSTAVAAAAATSTNIMSVHSSSSASSNADESTGIFS
jgi:hypothetical protein